MKTFLLLSLLLTGINCVSAQTSYSFVFLNKKPGTEKLPEEEIKKIMDGHMANIQRLAKEKKLLAAGPFDGGGGIFILNTTHPDEAKNWLSTDPGIQAKRWDVEILPYTPRYGGVCPVGEKYEMISYTLVRFVPVAAKYTVGNYGETLHRHDAYIRELRSTGNVITDATFGNNEGGIIIMKGDVQQGIFESDPGVREGTIEASVKKLYIAKGSFCEK